MGELKPTKMVILLAARWIRLPIGMVEDVLIRVGKFIYSVDFIMVQTKNVGNTASLVPVILQRHFFVAANALINCRSGIMT